MPAGTFAFTMHRGAVNGGYTFELRTAAGDVVAVLISNTVWAAFGW